LAIPFLERVKAFFGNLVVRPRIAGPHFFEGIIAGLSIALGVSDNALGTLLDTKAFTTAVRPKAPGRKQAILAIIAFLKVVAEFVVIFKPQGWSATMVGEFLRISMPYSKRGFASGRASAPRTPWSPLPINARVASVIVAKANLLPGFWITGFSSVSWCSHHFTMASMNTGAAAF